MVTYTRGAATNGVFLRMYTMFYHLRFTVSLRILELVQDFGLGMCRKEADFETDDMILAKLK